MFQSFFPWLCILIKYLIGPKNLKPLWKPSNQINPRQSRSILPRSRPITGDSYILRALIGLFACYFALVVFGQKQKHITQKWITLVLCYNTSTIFENRSKISTHVVSLILTFMFYRNAKSCSWFALRWWRRAFFLRLWNHNERSMYRPITKVSNDGSLQIFMQFL